MKELTQKLNSIREALDMPVFDPETGEENTNIDSVESKLIKLSALMGLSAETMAAAKKQLRQKELEVLQGIDKNLSPSVITKTLAASTWEQEAILTYADRLNSALVHNMDALRTIISKYKEELRNSQFQV